MNWVWELVTADGHVAQQSQEFMKRADCEADALRQGLPVQGLARILRRIRKAARIEKVGPSLMLLEDRSAGLWCWQRVNEQGKALELSTRAFLTRAECVADARKSNDVYP
jgi:hypothetical protein